MPRILVSFKETGDSDYFNLVVSLETFVTMRYINLHLPYHTMPFPVCWRIVFKPAAAGPVSYQWRLRSLSTGTAYG